MSQRVKMGERRRRQAERALAARQALALEMADPASGLGRALRAAYGTGFRVAPVPAPGVFADVKSLRARQAACSHEGAFPGGMCLRCGAVVLHALSPRPAPRMVVGLDLAAGPDKTVKTTVRIVGLRPVAELFEQLGEAVGAVGDGLARHLDRLREQQDERIKSAFLEAKIPQADDGNRVVREAEKAGEK